MSVIMGTFSTNWKFSVELFQQRYNIVFMITCIFINYEWLQLRNEVDIW